MKETLFLIFKKKEKTHRIPSVDKNVFEENRTINLFKIFK